VISDPAPTIAVDDVVKESRGLSLATFVDSGIGIMAGLVHGAGKIRAAILCKSVRTRRIEQKTGREPTLPLTSW
jgi:hypothetical protein